MSANQELVDKLAETMKDLKENKVSKTEVESMINELKDAITENKDKHSSEEFIKHMTECDDKNCAIHMMAKDFEKKGLLKGMALQEKLLKVNN